MNACEYDGTYLQTTRKLDSEASRLYYQLTATCNTAADTT